MYVPTYTGCRLNVADPLPQQIHALDIACGLSRTPRFAGQTEHFYCTAQHALLVETIAQRSLPAPRREFRLGALLRCAPQAYLGAMTGPVRAALDQLAPGAMAQLQARLSCAIERRFGLQLDMAEVVLINVAEREALRCEREDLGIDPGAHWPELHNVLRPMGIRRLEPMTADQARVAFVVRFMELWGGLDS